MAFPLHQEPGKRTLIWGSTLCLHQTNQAQWGAGRWFPQVRSAYS